MLGIFIFFGLTFTGIRSQERLRIRKSFDFRYMTQFRNSGFLKALTLVLSILMTQQAVVITYVNDIGKFAKVLDTLDLAIFDLLPDFPESSDEDTPPTNGTIPEPLETGSEEDRSEMEHKKVNTFLSMRAMAPDRYNSKNRVSYLNMYQSIPLSVATPPPEC